MTRTMADHARAYRQRKAKKLERLAVLESALREIVLTTTDDIACDIARQAINPDAKEQGA